MQFHAEALYYLAGPIQGILLALAMGGALSSLMVWGYERWKKETRK